MLKDYPYFKKKDFEYLCGRIQVLIPDNMARVLYSASDLVRRLRRMK